MVLNPYGEIINLLDSIKEIADERTNTFIDILPIGIIILDARGKIVYANNEAHRIIQVNDDLGITLHDADGTEIPFEQGIFLSNRNNSENSESQEIYVKIGSGLEKVLLMSGTTICGSNMKTGTVVVFQDITANKNREVRIRENERTIKSLINSVTESMVLVDEKGKIILANDTVSSSLKMPVSQVIGRNIFNILSPEFVEIYKKHIQIVIDKANTSHFEDEQNGNFYNHIFSPVFDSKHKVTKVAILSQNITESKRIERALKDSEARFRNIFESTASGIALVSLEGYYFVVNEALSNIVGYSIEELSNMSIIDLTHPEDLKNELKLIEKLMKGEITNYQFEKRYTHKDGSIVWVLLTRSLVRDSKGDPFYTIGQIQNITLQKQAEEELQQAKLEAEEARAKAELLARTDYLTGLLNRRAFMERLTEEESKAVRQKSNMTVVLADVDYFKRVNDTYGHKVGDIVLQACSEGIKGICRPYDFIGRYGGEEFVICLIDVDLEQGKIITERMRRAVESLEIDMQEGKGVIKITASFGLATAIPIAAGFAEKLIEKADEAMYKAKRQGRNRVVAELAEITFA